MAITKTNRLNMTGGGVPVIVRLSQYDDDFTLVFELYSTDGTFTIASGTTAAIRGTKADGMGYSVDATLDISNKRVTVTGDQQMTAMAGKNVFELTLSKSNKELNTANFILDVERAALDKDTLKSDSVIKELVNVIDRTDEIIAAANLADAAVDNAESLVEQTGNNALRAEEAANLAQLYARDMRVPLLACFRNVAWINEDGEQYYQALYNALYPPAELVSISAVFNQGTHDVHPGDSLDSLKEYLTVSANYSDGTSETVTNYTLSGTLTVGIRSIMASYSGKTASFLVTVTPSSVTVTSIDAVFTQGSAVIYDDDTLDDLRQYLTVTATFSDSTTMAVTNYALSGSLTAGTSTITATYGGQSDTFSVNVAKRWSYEWYATSQILPPDMTFGDEYTPVFDGDNGLHCLRPNLAFDNNGRDCELEVELKYDTTLSNLGAFAPQICVAKSVSSTSSNTAYLRGLTGNNQTNIKARCKGTNDIDTGYAQDVFHIYNIYLQGNIYYLRLDNTLIDSSGEGRDFNNEQNTGVISTGTARAYAYIKSIKYRLLPTQDGD